MVLGSFTWFVKPSWADALLLDVWVIYLVLALVGAFFGVSAVLAGRNLLRSPLWLLATVAGLILLSWPIVDAFTRDTRAADQFIERADATQGVVRSKFVRGGIRLSVEYEVNGRTYRTLIDGDEANGQFTPGDPIWVYFEPNRPENAVVRYPGPNPRDLLIGLSWLWGIAGILITAYLPLVPWVLRQIATDLRTPPANQPLNRTLRAGWLVVRRLPERSCDR